MHPDEIAGAQSHTYEPSILRGWFGGDDYIRYLMLPGFIFHISIVSELRGIDCARVSFLAQEEIAASCAGAVGCDITQLPGVEIGLSDDRWQVHTLATSLAAHRRPGGDWRSTRVGPAGRLPSADSVGGLAALFGQRQEAHVHEWSESQVLNDAIVLTGPSVRAEQFEAAANMRRHRASAAGMHLTRSFLHRCPRRSGICRSPEITGDKTMSDPLLPHRHRRGED